MLFCVEDFLKNASALLPQSSTSRLDIELLLCEQLDCSRAALLMDAQRVLTPLDREMMRCWIDRRAAGYPMAYLLKRRDFWNLTLKVNEHTLIPRPETELLVEKALEHIHADQDPWILDLGTGSGAVALAIAQEKLDAWVVAVDVDEAALFVAQENSQTYHCSKFYCVASHWCQGLNHRFDLIVSNPPYIKAQDEHLQKGDLVFEPQNALVSGETGLEDLYSIIDQGRSYLKSGAFLYLEHGFDQAFSVRNFLKAMGYVSIETYLDLSGLERVTRGCFYHER